MEFEAAGDPALKQARQSQEQSSPQPNDDAMMLQVQSHISPAGDQTLDQEALARDPSHQRAHPLPCPQGDQ